MCKEAIRKKEITVCTLQQRRASIVVKEANNAEKSNSREANQYDTSASRAEVVM